MDGTIVEMCGMRWPRDGERKPVDESRKSTKYTIGEVHVRHIRSDKNKDKEKRIKDKTHTDLEPEDITVHTRSEGPTVQQCGDSSEGCKDKSDRFKRPHTHGRKGKSSSRSRTLTACETCSQNTKRKKITGITIGAQGRRKIVIDRRNDSATWKAMRGFWDGSFKDNGKSVCGIVVKGVDREGWVTINKIAILLKVGGAMTTEIAGVCVLTSMLDLILCKCLSVQTVNQRINRILNNPPILHAHLTN